MNRNALSDLKVVELGEFITAPYCTELLSCWGAEVIKVEPPGRGDKSRHHGPFPNDKPDIEKSGLYLFINANKKSVTLNVKDPKGRKILIEILKDADIFVENNAPKMMKELGLDYDSLKKDYPKLIMISITPWGQTGPYKDYKGHGISFAAASGASSLHGNPDREPLLHPMSWLEYYTGVCGALAAMVAIIARDISGKGQYCEQYCERFER